MSGSSRPSGRTIIVETMHGFGDNVMVRPTVRSLIPGNDVYVRTCWPELFHDLPVKLLRPDTSLRTQARNVERFSNWSSRPAHPYERIHIRYDTRDWLEGRGAASAMLHNAQVSRSTGFELPWTDKPRLRKTKPLAIVIPPTIREEWRNVARPPNPRYMQQLVHQHREFEWMEITDLAEGEVLYGEPISGVRSIGGLTTSQLIGLLSVADVIVTGPGYALPLGIALRVPVLCLYGGDLPGRLLVESWMLDAPYRGVEPRPFCECGLQGRHTEDVCNKELDPNEVERAFTEVACRPLLQWENGRGYYPVNVDGQYNASYYDNYARLACTGMGTEITDFRCRITKKHFPDQKVVDVGPGACQFVEAYGAYGYDINPKTNEHLSRIGRFAEFGKRYPVLTFWDSLEHLPDMEAHLRQATVGVIVSMPIYEDRNHVVNSRHFKPAEHIHYFTHEAFLTFMEDQGFKVLDYCDTETVLGREGIRTYAFSR